MQADQRLFDFVRVFLARSVFVGSAACVTAVACGAPLEGDGDDLSGTRTEALQIAGDPAATVYWDGPQALGPVTAATGTPALASHCAASLVAFTRVSSNNRFRGAAAGELGPSAWADYAPRAFASSPSVTGLPNDCDGQRFLIVGRGAGTGENSRIFWSEGRATQSQGVFDSPQATTIFTQVSSQNFTGENGYPAVTSSPNGDALLVYRSGNTVYGHTKFVGANSWSSAHAAPALPPEWVPIGVPAIEFSFANNATVIIRGQKGASVRLFRIFYNNGFGDPLGPVEWDALPLPAGSPVISSDPALEWNDTLWTHTVYYRSADNAFYQASIFYNTWEHVPKRVVNTVTTPTYDDAPAVNGNADYEQLRTHWVLGRSGTQLYFSVIMQGDSGLEP